MDPVRLLWDMVNIRSESGAENELAMYLILRMSQMGFQSQIDDAGNAVGILGDGPNQLVFLGHMDTVPGGPEPKLKNGCLHGRGAVDAKGALAAFIMSAAKTGEIPGWQIVIIGAVEEEIPTSKGARFVVSEYTPNYCVIGEPSGWNGVTLGYKGRLVMNYSFTQPQSHPAGPGDSPAEHAIHLWNRIQGEISAYNDGIEGVFHAIQGRIPSFHAGINGDDESAEAEFAFRLPPKVSPEEWFQRISRLHPNGAIVQLMEGIPAFQNDRRSELVKAFGRVIRGQQEKIHYKVKTGTSDMNIVGPEWNCPIVAYGPGDSSLDHTPDEHIRLTEYQLSIDILTEVIETITGEEAE